MNKTTIQSSVAALFSALALLVLIEGPGFGVTKVLTDTDSTQTLTNKTLTSPTITGSVAGGASYANVSLTGTVTGGATYSNIDLSGNTGPLRHLGDTLYAAANGAMTKLAGNITATQKYLAQTGTGTVSAAPSWVSLAIVSADLPSGTVVNSKSTVYATASSTATVMPADNTIPQITEGAEFFTVSITPKASANRLVLIATIHVNTATAGDALGCALFQDATANALASTFSELSGNNRFAVLTIHHEMAAGTTSATTFRVRCGPGGAVTLYLHQDSGGNNKQGGVMQSGITVWEVKT